MANKVPLIVLRLAAALMISAALSRIVVPACLLFYPVYHQLTLRLYSVATTTS